MVCDEFGCCGVLGGLGWIWLLVVGMRACLGLCDLCGVDII